MRQFIACVLAAMIGSGFTLWILDSQYSGRGLVVAQTPANGPDLPRLPPVQTDTIPPAAVIPSRLFDANGLSPDEAISVAVYENCNRSVVNISTLSMRTDRLFLTIPEEGNGSGAVLDRSGHILTNFHVVQGARQINVVLFNEDSYPAKLVGADPVNDIAVLKVDAPAEDLFPVTLGDSDDLRVGMRVFALGNPFGLERSMSEGIISSLNRTLEIQRNWVIKSIIQIDASINPGNSGGPLLNSHGQLIGMNTAIASRVDQSAGIGFAIPINLIRRVVPELVEHGRVIRGDIGITHVTVGEQGLRVARLEPNGPAEKAGIRGPKMTGRYPIVIVDRSAADIIVAVDGTQVTTAAEFLGLIESKKPGNVVRLTVIRDGELVTVPIELGGEQRPNSRDTRM